MRQRFLLFIFSAVVVILQLSAWGSFLFAEGGKIETRAGRGFESNAAAYDSTGTEGYRDIMPEFTGCMFNCSDIRCRAVPVRRDEKSKCGITVYTVKGGDTLYSISKKTGASVESITGQNGIRGNRIYSGMKLKINTCENRSKVQSDDNGAGKDFCPKSPSYSVNFLWPLRKVNSYRRDGNDDIKSLGIFITGGPDSDVVASLDGVVKKIGYMRGYGRYIAISHDDRYVTVYSNLSGVRVKEGGRVSKGMVIGSLSGDRTLHFQIGHAGKPENPLKHLPGRNKG